MSTQLDPPHNLKALTIGTGEFSFSPGATSAANARARGYIDFGNVAALTPAVEPTKEEHFGSYRGVRRKDRVVVTENSLQYQLRCDEWNRQIIEILMGASTTTGHTQAIQTAAAGEVLGFTATPAVIGRWYEIRTSAGLRLRTLTTVTITGKVEGTDFDLDLLLGRIRFKTAQAADLTPTITAPAITADTAASFLGLIPLADPVKSGYGRLVLYDQDDDNKVILDHQEFSCDVSVESVSEVDGTGFTDMTINVDVTDTPGVMFVRNDNDNAGF
jgi:hypothetical protein